MDNMERLVRRALKPHFPNLQIVNVEGSQADSVFACDFLVRAGGHPQYLPDGFLGCRIRDIWYLQKYSHQITIRSKLISGRPTELDKVRAHQGKSSLPFRMFYGFGDEQDPELTEWALFEPNLDAAFVEKRNPGENWFRAYNLADMKNVYPPLVAATANIQRPNQAHKQPSLW